MINYKKIVFAILILSLSLAITSTAQVTLIPMDLSQANHLKAYGIAFKALKMGKSVEWFLNYRGGAFAFDSNDELLSLCLIMGVTTEEIGSSQLADIYRIIDVETFVTHPTGG